MTSNQILKADVLDILFENRNKTYGAYALRKEYDKRLWLALGIAMSTILLMWFLSNLKSNQHNQLYGINRDTVKLISIDPPPPPEPPKPPQSAPPEKPIEAQRTFVNQIQLVADNVQPTMPTTNDLTMANIGNTDVAGDVPGGTAHPALTNNTITNAPPTEAPQPSFVPLERQPEFPGGISALAEFLSRNLITPSDMEAGEKKTVYVKFMVNEDGTVTQFEIVKSAGTSYDKEVLRVMKKMPKWKPAIQNGHNVTTTFTQPVTFQAIEE